LFLIPRHGWLTMDNHPSLPSCPGCPVVKRELPSQAAAVVPLVAEAVVAEPVEVEAVPAGQKA
jgi:hypothetical protein